MSSKCCICLSNLDKEHFQLECCNNHIHNKCKSALLTHKIFTCPLCRSTIIEMNNLASPAIIPIPPEIPCTIEHCYIQIICTGICLILFSIIIYVFYH